MPRVLVLADRDLTPELGRTILWRASVERRTARRLEDGIDIARSFAPSIIVVDASNGGDGLGTVRALRANPVSRPTAIIALASRSGFTEELPLRQAGANVVLAGEVDPFLWDTRLEELLYVPRRRDARIPVRLVTWSRAGHEGVAANGLTLNVSVHGLLLEASRTMELGTKLDLRFCLPGEDTELTMVGQVVREAGAQEERYRYGVKFLVLREDASERIARFVEASLRDVGADATAAAGPGVLAGERSQWEAELRGTEASKSVLLESALDSIVTIDIEGRILEWNRAAEQTFGWTRAEAMGRQVDELIIPPAWREGHRRGLAHHLATGKGHFLGRRVEVTALRRGGSEFPVELAITPLQLDRRRLFLAYLRDITQRRQAEEALQASEQRYRLLFERNLAGVYRLGLEGRVRDANDACARILGYEGRADLLGQRAHAHFVEGEAAALLRWLRRRRTLASTEVRLRRRDGEVVWVLATVNLMQEAEDEVLEGTLIDITDRKIAAERIQHQAYHDTLTGLPNRALFTDRLTLALAHARRQSRGLAVCYMDLDHFKNVNDTLGHSTGDILLQGVAQRLTGCLRGDDTVARVGGDEFILLLPDAGQPSAAATVAEKVLAEFERPFEIDGRPFYVTASLGISLHPGDGSDPETLLRNADNALYRAKESGRNTYQLFTAEMNARVLHRLSVEQALRGALERSEFVLHYQPQVRIADGRVVGFEALLRWNDPGRGQVAPGEFIGLAEDTGLIVPIGDWVLREACRQAGLLGPSGAPRVSVNVSARQFHQSDLVAMTRGALQATGLDPQRLELEITESVAMLNVEQAVATLAALRDMGVRLAFDDFGTGYASLGYLKRFPIHSLKIDQGFVRDVGQDPADAAIVRAVIEMAHALGLTAVAEGVESVDQLEFLARHGCDAFQGWLSGRPFPPEEIAAYLRGRPS